MIVFHLAAMAALSFVMGRAARSIAGSVRIVAKRLGFSDFLIAFGLLGLATSIPEISVAVFSSLKGTPGLSLGNLLGANVVILSLLAGLAAILGKKLSPGDFYRNYTLPLFLLDVLLPAYAIADGRLTRMDGVFLTLAHVAFIGHMYRSRRATLDAGLENESDRRRIRHHALTALVAVVVLLTASYFLVQSAIAVASALGTPPIIIGLLLFSVGTNLPELTFVITQTRNHKEIVLGDLFGSVLLNTPTLGLLALISPFEIEQWTAAWVSACFLAVLVGLFGYFMWTKRSLVRREGYWLVAFYLVFLLYYLRFL
jgi:cation:H+ antiporter